MDYFWCGVDIMSALQQMMAAYGGNSKSWKTVVYSEGTSNWRGLCMSDDGTKIVACAYQNSTGDPDTGFLYVSSDSGATWNVRQNLNTMGEVAMSPDGSFIIFRLSTSGTTRTYTSTDLGVTRTLLTGVTAYSKFKVINNTGKIFAVASNGVYYSTDYGVSWTRGAGQPNTIPNSYDVSEDGTKVFANYDTNPSQYYSSDGGVNFSSKAGYYPTTLSARISNDGTKFALARPFSSPDFFIYSSDSWATVVKPTIPSGVSTFAYLEFSDDGNTLYAHCEMSASPFYKIFTTTDGGSSWNVLDGSEGRSYGTAGLTVKNGSIYFFGTNLNFYN